MFAEMQPALYHLCEFKAFSIPLIVYLFAIVLVQNPQKDPDFMWVHSLLHISPFSKHYSLSWCTMKRLCFHSDFGPVEPNKS